MSIVKASALIPPDVQTGLGGERQKNDLREMPLDAFIAETIDILKRGLSRGRRT